MSNAPTRPLPQPTSATRGFWEAAAGHRLVIQRCQACGHRQFFPRPFCLACQSGEMGWMDCSGKGTIYTFTINHRAPGSFMKERLPYAVAVIELDEGVRMLANILHASLADIAIGKRVRVVFEQATPEIALPQFELEPA